MEMSFQESPIDQVSTGSGEREPTSGPTEPPAVASLASPVRASPASPAVSRAGGSARLATSCLRPAPLEAEAGTTSMKSWLRKPTACPSQRRCR